MGKSAGDFQEERVIVPRGTVWKAQRIWSILNPAGLS
jgi:hypothetical protein